MRALLSLAAAALALSAFACAAPADPASTATEAISQEAEDTIKVGERDNGSTVQISAGQKLVVALPSNSSTGYTWMVEKNTMGDPAIAHEAPESGPIGAGSVQVFTFADTAGLTGEHTLKLIYQRPWAETVPPAKTFELKVELVPRRCGGFAGFTCPDGQFCAYEAGDRCGFADALGTCTPKPEMCPRVYMPVCGCDGQTYGNHCDAASAGASVMRDGACE